MHVHVSYVFCGRIIRNTFPKRKKLAKFPQDVDPQPYSGYSDTQAVQASDADVEPLDLSPDSTSTIKTSTSTAPTVAAQYSEVIASSPLNQCAQASNGQNNLANYLILG